MIGLVTRFKEFIVVGLILGLAAVWIYNVVYQRGYAAAEIVAANEAAKIKKANEDAIAKAERDLKQSLGAMAREKEKLENDIERLDREASTDQSGSSCGLQRSGVQRVNSIQ